MDWENEIGLIRLNSLLNISNAIQYKLGVAEQYYPQDMPNAINNIEGCPPNVYFQYPPVGNKASQYYVGSEVTDMSNGFYYHGYGEPATGPNVVDMRWTYAECPDISGTINFTQNFNDTNSSDLVNGYMMFLNRDTSTKLFINVAENSSWQNWFNNHATIYSDTPLQWSIANEYYMINTATNTYLEGRPGNLVDLNHFTVDPNAQYLTVRLKVDMG